MRAYEIEVAFYSQVAPLPGVPRCYHAAHDPESGDFTIVLQDMAPCVTGDDLTGCDRERAGACLRALAQVHAQAWEDPTLAGHEWLNRAPPEQRARMVGVVTMLAPAFLDRFGPRLSDEHRALVVRMIPKLDVIIDAHRGLSGTSRSRARPEHVNGFEAAAGPVASPNARHSRCDGRDEPWQHSRSGVRGRSGRSLRRRGS